LFIENISIARSFFERFFNGQKRRDGKPRVGVAVVLRVIIAEYATRKMQATSKLASDASNKQQ
jgi:hypothetical protein